jgi:hypothetical protein
MRTRFIALTMALAMAASMSTACIGNFALVGKVRKFNLDFNPGRWERELLFFAFYVIPVYPFSGMIDLLIINSIEFWTGTNPISEEPSVTPVSQRTFTTEDGTQVTMTRGVDLDTLDVELLTTAGETRHLELVRTATGVIVRDERGNDIVDSGLRYIAPEAAEIL